MARQTVSSYSFDPRARTVTLTGLTTVDKKCIVSIINQRTNENYYLRQDAARVQLTGKILTLPVGVITISASPSDPLLITYDPALADPTAPGTTVAIADVPGLQAALDAKATVAALTNKVATVVYAGSLSAARPTADSVYWVGFPSTPINAQAQDIVEGASTTIADVTGLQTALGSGVPDYYVSRSGSTITCYPRQGSGLAQFSGTNGTPINQAIAALCPVGGARGSGGGLIQFSGQNFDLGGVQITIAGWETASLANYPLSQLVLQGRGLQTQFVQNGAGVHAFKTNNCSSVVFKDFYVYCGASAKSAIVMDNDGASNMGGWKSRIDNVQVYSASTTNAAIHLKNFFSIDVPKLIVESANHGVLLENNDATTHFGNSHFGYVASKTTGNNATYAGLAIITNHATDTYQKMNLLQFDHFECVGYGGIGLYTKGAAFCTFGFVDIEAQDTCIFFDCTALGSRESRHVSILSGYAIAKAGGTVIKGSLGAGGNYVKLRTDSSSDDGSTVINDPMQFLPRNEYDLFVGDVAKATRTITSPDKQIVRFITDNDSVLDTRLVPQTTNVTTAAGTTVLVVSSSPVQVATGTAVQTFQLPTTGVTKGMSWTVINNSTSSLTINASNGAFIGTLVAGLTLTVMAVQNTPTLPAHWASQGHLAAGTSASTGAITNTLAQRNGNANVLADVFLPSSTSVATAGTTTTLTVDSTEVQTFTGTNVQTASLPTSSVQAGHPLTLINLSTGIVTVNASGGGSVAKLEPKATLRVQANIATPTTPAHWSIVGGTAFVAGRLDPNSLWAAGNAEPFARQGNAVVGSGSGNAAFSYFTAPVANVITKLAIPTEGTASAGLTLGRLGLYTIAANGDATLVARIANTTTLGNTLDTLTPVALDATGGYVTTYTFIPGQRYALAMLFVGTTAPGILTVTNAASAPFGVTPKLAAVVFSQTDLAASYTSAQLSNNSFYAPWIVGLP